MAAAVRVRHDIEFLRGYLIQGTQKPIAPRLGREGAYVGLDPLSILRVRRSNRHSFSTRQMHCMNLVTQSTDRHDAVLAWLSVCPCPAGHRRAPLRNTAC